MQIKTPILVCFISVWSFSQEIVEEIDTIDMAAPEYNETDTVITASPIQESTGETGNKERYTPVQQEKVNLQETIPEPPTRPIAQTIIGSVLTGSGGLVLILDFILLGMENSTYGEVRPSSKPMIAIYAIGGGIEFICGIGLLSVASPKWKEYNEWEAKYQPQSMNTLKINMTFNF